MAGEAVAVSSMEAAVVVSDVEAVVALDEVFARAVVAFTTEVWVKVATVVCCEGQVGSDRRQMSVLGTACGEVRGQKSEVKKHKKT